MNTKQTIINKIKERACLPDSYSESDDIISKEDLINSLTQDSDNK